MISNFQEVYPKLADSEISERTAKAILLFKKIAQKAREEDWEIVFLSGFAVDAHFGYLTRQHKDIDIMARVQVVPKIRLFLESEGHTVYEPEKVKGECLKVDQAEPDKPMRSHGDIHYFWEDVEGKVTMPLLGKELKLSAGVKEVSEELAFLGETARFLKPAYLLEEKRGWHEQVGLAVWPENLSEIEKIKYLIAHTLEI
jgi:hypothetical protein